MLCEDAYGRRIRIASSLATGAKVSPKSKPFVAHHHTMLIFLVLEHPFGSNDILAFWSFNKLPYLIPCEVVQLILHCHDPILFLQGVIYILGFYTRDKGNMLTKGCMILRASFYPW